MRHVLKTHNLCWPSLRFGGLMLACSFGCVPATPDVPTGPPAENVATERVVDGLDLAVALAFAPDGRIFFTEKGGILRVIDNGQLVEEPVAEFSVDTVNERGLLGVALHPGFAQNDRVYLYYTRRDEAGTTVDNRVVRVTLDGNSAVGDETLIASLPVGGLFSSNHNGGNIRFGPDDKLYVTLGDVGVSESAQDPDALSGRILRYNDDGSIPEDNPLGPANPTYALGLRNSFDLAFDPISGTLFATENSTNARDEINRIVSGGNYGWPEVQGSSESAFQNPLIDLGDSSVVPTGIDFAPDARYGTDRRGKLFYGEFLFGRVHCVELNANRDEAALRTLFVDGLPSITDVAFAPDGTLYILTLSALHRVVLSSTEP